MHTVTQILLLVDKCTVKGAFQLAVGTEQSILAGYYQNNALTFGYLGLLGGQLFVQHAVDLLLILGADITDIAADIPTIIRLVPSHLVDRLGVRSREDVMFPGKLVGLVTRPADVGTLLRATFNLKNGEQI